MFAHHPKMQRFAAWNGTKPQDVPQLPDLSTAFYGPANMLDSRHNGYMQIFYLLGGYVDIIMHAPLFELDTMKTYHD